jgi:hypothetical protein
LFDDSEDEKARDGDDEVAETKLDEMAAKEGLSKFLNKVDTHLNVEKVLISDFLEKNPRKGKFEFFDNKK